jgi:hypothetical protein
MAGAGPVAFRRIDLALGIHKAAQEVSVFVVDLFDLVFAEKTSLFLVLLGIIVVDISHKFALGYWFTVNCSQIGSISHTVSR